MEPQGGWVSIEAGHVVISVAADSAGGMAANKVFEPLYIYVHLCIERIASSVHKASITVFAGFKHFVTADIFEFVAGHKIR